LWQERLYRKLYDWVVNNKLKTDEYLFDMNAYRFKEEVQAKFRIMFSITLGWLYGSIVILVYNLRFNSTNHKRRRLKWLEECFSVFTTT